MATLGAGASVKFGESPSITTINKVISVNLPDFQVSQIDTTHLGITDFATTSEPGSITAGPVTVNAEFSEATWVALHEIIRVVKKWTFGGPATDPFTVACDGYLTSMPTQFTGAFDKVVIQFVVQLTGLPVVTESE